MASKTKLGKRPEPMKEAMAAGPKKLLSVKAAEEAFPVGLVAPDFEADYVAGVIAPFMLSSEYTGEIPVLPMIDLALTKEKAIPVQLWGMLYEEHSGPVVDPTTVCPAY